MTDFLDDLVPRPGYAPAHRLFDAATLGWHFRVAAATIYRWVSEDRLPVYPAPAGLRERRRYDLLDVQRAHDKRRKPQRTGALDSEPTCGEDQELNMGHA